MIFMAFVLGYYFEAIMKAIMGLSVEGIISEAHYMANCEGTSSKESCATAYKFHAYTAGDAADDVVGAAKSGVDTGKKAIHGGVAAAESSNFQEYLDAPGELLRGINW